MVPFLVIFSSLTTFALTPIIIKLAKKFSLVDLPSRPHPAILHKKPVPRAGGVPVFIGIFLTLAILLGIQIIPFDKKLAGISLASLILIVVGLADDRYDISPYLRLGINALVVLIVVGVGIGISSFTNPFGGQVILDSWRIKFFIPGDTFFSGAHSIIVWSDLLALVWVVWVMNALNWSSGVDGQLPGIAAISFFFIGLISLRDLGSDPTQLMTAVIAFTACGSYLGFLPWSFYPQKIMPGYGGSTLAGFLLATLAILSGAKLATAILVLAVPLIDGLWAVIRRIARKRSPVWGDREHLHHQLLQLGWSIPKIAFFYYLLTFLLGITALSLNSEGKGFALALIAVIIFGFILTISRTRYENT